MRLHRRLFLRLTATLLFAPRRALAPVRRTPMGFTPNLIPNGAAVASMRAIASIMRGDALPSSWEVAPSSAIWNPSSPGPHTWIVLPHKFPTRHG